MGCLTHELRTPVNCVISILKTLEDYLADSDEARKLMTICQGTIEMLKSLTEDFIDFTRFENNKGLPVQKSEVHVNNFFKDIDNIFSFQAEEKGIQFKINMDSELPDTIQTDPKRLKQVILNLLSNSFKFTQKGKIEISLFPKKRRNTCKANSLNVGEEIKNCRTFTTKSVLKTRLMKNSNEEMGQYGTKDF